MRKFLRTYGLTLAFLAFSSALIHAAHLDDSHLSQKTSHDCVVCQTTSAGDAPTTFTFTPIFETSFTISSLGVLLPQNEFLASTCPRGPPYA